MGPGKQEAMTVNNVHDVEGNHSMTMPSFTTTAEEYENNRQSGGDVWIKGFRDGVTKIRPLVEPTKWIKYREHYAEGFGYFPCSEFKDCVGCNDDSEKTRQRSNKYAFNGLDDRGRQQVYKAGHRLYTQLKNRQNRIGTIIDRDYEIIRTGKNFNDINYTPEPGDKYEVDLSDVGQLYNVSKLLVDKYKEAVEAYTGGIKAPTPEPSEEKPQTWSYSGNDEAQTVSKDNWLAPEGSENTPSPFDQTANGDSPATPSGHPNPDKMNAVDLRTFLTEKGVDFPPKAPRSRLVKHAEVYLAENPA